MTRTSRNAPCPCGSGRKYKACCLPTDRAAGRAPPDALAPVRDAARKTDTWEAEAVPLAIGFEDDPAIRPVALLVTAAGFPVNANVVGDLGGEAEDVAAALENAVVAAGQRTGVLPERLHVRHDSVARHLAPRLGLRGVDVRVRGRLPDLGEAARGLMQHLGSAGDYPGASSPDQWAGWGFEPAETAELFGAVAAYRRAEPWRVLQSSQPVLVRAPSGCEWLVNVLGSEGEAFGIALYEKPDDFRAVLERGTPFGGSEPLEGRMLAVAFDRREDLPRPMLREIADAGWEVASPDAYPRLIVVNTPGGGVSRAGRHDLVAALLAVGAYVQSSERLTASGWQHPETGVRILEAPRFTPDLGGDADQGPPLGEVDLTGVLDEALSRFPAAIRDAVEDELRAGARNPEDLMARMGPRIAAYNTTPQAELGGLSPDQARALLDSDWEADRPLKLSTELAPADLAAVPMLVRARGFLDYLAERQPLRTTTAGNLPRAAVGEVVERFDPDARRRYDRILSASRAVNEQDVWSVHITRVLAKLGGLLRFRHKAFHITRKGESLRGEARAGELFALLFRTYFRGFNIGYLRYGDPAEIQYLVPLILHRLRTAADAWTDGRSLAADVLPPELLEREGQQERDLLGPAGFAGVRCEGLVFGALVDFGLLESRELSGSDTPRSEYRKTPLFDRFLTFRLTAGS